jgi:hypothetical protein
MRKLLLLALLPILVRAADDRYLQIARTFVDTMMAKGTDRYGTVQSPLFAALLDLETLSLPNPNPPSEFFEARSGQLRAIGFGFPNPPVGVRSGDRAPLGNNLEHDIMLLKAMYRLSEITGDRKYAEHAGAYLRFWLVNCQSPATGLMASGEHMSWDFVRERAYANVHETFRRFPFHDQLYAIDPYRALRIADALWLSKMGNKKVGDFSRHSGYESYKTDVGAAFPRHAGFYIWEYANAYVQSRDPKYVHRIEVLIESRTGRQLYPDSLLVERGSFVPERSAAPTLLALIWDAAELVPHRKQAWRNLVGEVDEQSFQSTPDRRPTSATVSRMSREDINSLEKRFPGILKNEREISGANPNSGWFTRSTALSRQWALAYGSPGASGGALLNLTRFHQTKDQRFLRLVEQQADHYLQEGLPKATFDLWPRACGQVISLMLALAREEAVARNKQETYRAFARDLADLSIKVFQKNGLFRADGSAEHYEAITGADDLVWALLQLHCSLNRQDIKMEHIDVNW